MAAKRRVNNGDRLPRYTRAKRPPGISVQPRDVLILMAVACHYRYLTTRQIHMLFFGGSMSKTRLRLTKLYHNRYLDRVHRPTVKGSGEAIYCLDKRGADMLASKLDVDRGSMLWHGRSKHLSPDSLEHAIRISDFRVAMSVACERTGLATMTGDWIDEQILKDLKQEVRVPSPSDPDRHTQCPLAADGYFRMELADGVLQSFMLEIDMGTESNRRFAQRVRAYREYLRSGKYAELFGSASFKALIVTTSSRRAENLLNTARRAGDKTMFWFTDFSQYSHDGELVPEQLMRRIWRVPGDWFAVVDEWRDDEYVEVVRPRDDGTYRSLLELAGTAGG